MKHHIGSSIIWLDQIDSTNNIAREWTDSGNINDGTIICAHYQTDGRGQDNTKWESEAGKNLAFSLMLFPHQLDAAEQLKLNISVSLAVRDFVNHYVPDAASIKWPNDIYAGNQKISGILIENSIQGESIRQSICGIGININQDSFDSVKPTSLAMLTGMNHNIEQCLHKCVDYLNTRINLMYNYSLLELISQYEKVMYRINQYTEFLYNNEMLQGIVSGIDQNGCLRLETPEGIRLFRNKEIIWLQ